MLEPYIPLLSITLLGIAIILLALKLHLAHKDIAETLRTLHKDHEAIISIIKPRRTIADEVREILNEALKIKKTIDEMAEKWRS